MKILHKKCKKNIIYRFDAYIARLWHIIGWFFSLKRTAKRTINMFQKHQHYNISET